MKFADLFFNRIKFHNNKQIIFVILLGLFCRLVFTLFIAESYFNRSNIFADGDTMSWLNSFINLIDNGSYTINFDSEYSYFFRMPGYSFFIGVFYLLTGRDLTITYPLIACVQILLDLFSIYFIYKIGEKIFKVKRYGLLLAFIYAVYPFVIVWNPVVYSESISIFFMLLSLYYLISNSKAKYLLSGLFLSLAVLNRPQIMLLTLVYVGYIIYENKKVFSKQLIQFGLVIILIYGAWPIRNYINYKKVILTQDLRGAPNWNVDVISFMQYIYSVKSEWNPQFLNITQNKKVSFPKEAYGSKADSLKLERAVFLSKNCGSGFSHWNTYWKQSFDKSNCNNEIAKLFSELRESQINQHPFNFYIKIPLQNLEKALFKTSLSDSKSTIRKIASLLFYYRTLLIVFGLIGSFLMIKNNNPTGYLFVSYFLLLYLSLCFGTGVQFRNIEMRYFLPADILMMIPATYLVGLLMDRLRAKLFFKA